jgi:hypothetical protein
MQHVKYVENQGLNGFQTKYWKPPLTLSPARYNPQRNRSLFKLILCRTLIKNRKMSTDHPHVNRRIDIPPDEAIKPPLTFGEFPLDEAVLESKNIQNFKIKPEL